MYTDNFYCSPELALPLNVRKTVVAGTVKTNRKGQPKIAVRIKHSKDESVVSIEAVKNVHEMG